MYNYILQKQYLKYVETICAVGIKCIFGVIVKILCIFFVVQNVFQCFVITFNFFVPTHVKPDYNTLLVLQVGGSNTMQT